MLSLDETDFALCLMKLPLSLPPETVLHSIQLLFCDLIPQLCLLSPKDGKCVRTSVYIRANEWDVCKRFSIKEYKYRHPRKDQCCSKSSTTAGSSSHQHQLLGLSQTTFIFGRTQTAQNSYANDNNRRARCDDIVTTNLIDGALFSINKKLET